MKSKLKKIGKIILIVIAIILVLATIVWAVGIRLLIRHYAKEVTAKMEPASEYFTEFDLTIPDSVEVQNVTAHGVTATIPAEFEEIEPIGTTINYGIMDSEGNQTELILFLTPGDVSELALFSEKNMAEMTDTPLKKFAVKQLMKGFEDLGHGIPDNFYSAYKSFYLLTEEDYSFWNWKQGFAYVVNGMLKNVISFACDYTYIYETEDICGFLHVTDRTEKDNEGYSGPKYKVVAELLSTDDLSTDHTIIIGGDSLETIYAIINSVVIEQKD